MLLAQLASLREAGHQVVVLQMNGKPSDLLSYGITSYDMKRSSALWTASGLKSSAAMVLEEIE